MRNLSYSQSIMHHGNWIYPGILAMLVFLNSCSKPLDWPGSPLYTFENGDLKTTYPADLESARNAILGHFAHYDVVAYEDSTTKSPMFTFVISYGFTDFYLDSLGELIQSDRFVRASHKINQKNIILFLKMLTTILTKILKFFFPYIKPERKAFVSFYNQQKTQVNGESEKRLG